MGRRLPTFSERFAAQGSALADDVSDWNDRLQAGAMRNEMERKRQEMEAARGEAARQSKAALDQMTYWQENPTDAQITGAIQPGLDYALKYNDPQFYNMLTQQGDRLLAPTRAAEAQKRASAAADKGDRAFEFRKAQAQRDEFRGKVESIRDANDKLRARTIDGIGVAPNATAAKKIRDSTAEKDILVAQIKELQDIHTKYGREVAGSPAKARAIQLSNSIITTLKSQAKLGVMSKDDKDLLLTQVPEDITSWKQLNVGTMLEGAMRDVELKYQMGLNANLEEKWDDPNRKFTPYVEPQWTGEGESPVWTPPKKEEVKKEEKKDPIKVTMDMKPAKDWKEFVSLNGDAVRDYKRQFKEKYGDNPTREQTLEWIKKNLKAK